MVNNVHHVERKETLLWLLSKSLEVKSPHLLLFLTMHWQWSFPTFKHKTPGFNFLRLASCFYKLPSVSFTPEKNHTIWNAGNVSHCWFIKHILPAPPPPFSCHLSFFFFLHCCEICLNVGRHQFQNHTSDGHITWHWARSIYLTSCLHNIHLSVILLSPQSSKRFPHKNLVCILAPHQPPVCTVLCCLYKSWRSSLYNILNCLLVIN